jgi:hypothetical protein
MKRTMFLAVLAVFILILFSASCAPGPNDAEKTPGSKGHVAGFILGLWHGFISLFTRNVRLYEVHNNGSWYNFGFVLGAGLFLSGGIMGRKKSHKG